MEEDLRYSQNYAIINRAMFFAELKRTIIFVEDEEKEYVYEKILESFFPNIDFFINACGGKNNVENAYNDFGTNYDGCKCIYICDGDFDILINRERISNFNFIYLEKYELENYFVDHKSLLELYLGRAHGTRREAIKILNYENWYKDIIDSWFELMLLYIIVQKNEHIDMDTTGNSADKFLNRELPIVDLKLVQKYRNDVKIKLKEIDKNLNEEVKLLKKEIENKKIEKDSIVKGKYLISSAKSYIKYIIKNKKKTPSWNTEDVEILLLNSFDMNSLNYLKNKIEQILVN